MPTFENFAHRLARQIEADETFSRYGAVASTPEAEDDHLDVAHVSFANGTIIELRDKVGRGVHVATYDNEGDILEEHDLLPARDNEPTGTWYPRLKQAVYEEAEHARRTTDELLRDA